MHIYDVYFFLLVFLFSSRDYKLFQYKKTFMEQLWQNLCNVRIFLKITFATVSFSYVTHVEDVQHEEPLGKYTYPDLTSIIINSYSTRAFKQRDNVVQNSTQSYFTSEILFKKKLVDIIRFPISKK